MFARARWKPLFGLAIVGAVVLVAYFPILRVSFVGDDWIFYELAGRLSLPDYLVKYFDPSTQVAWYRPIQGIIFRLWYDVFRTDTLWYHLSNVLIHLAASVALYAVALRARMSKRSALIAALLFASFPTAVEGVFKPGVIDPLTALFALLAVWFWMAHLGETRFVIASPERAKQSPRDVDAPAAVSYSSTRNYWLAFGSFLIALYSKEIAVTLPLTLFLVDRFVVGEPSSFKELLRRYAWFVVAVVVYIPIEIIVVSRSVFVSREGYSTGLNLVTNLVDYLAVLAFPWQLPSPTNYVWLALGAVLVAYLIVVKRVFALLPLIANAILALLPIIPFPFVTYRFAYLSLTSSAILIALGFEWAWRRARSRWMAYSIGGVLALAVGIGSVGVSSAAVDFAEFARVTRVPFRNVSQAHPTFPNDSLVYFINPPLPGPNLSGMFFWRYGPSVVVRADDMNTLAGLRDHAAAFVDYFDEQGNQHELIVEKELSVRATPALPVVFSTPIQLEGYELVSANVKPDQPIVLFLYWRALDHIERDYTVLVQLIDPSGKPVAGYDKEPRRGKAPTRRWTPGELIADVIQLPITQVPPGIYRLAVGLFDVESSKRLSILDSAGQVVGDQIIIEPLRVAE